MALPSPIELELIKEFRNRISDIKLDEYESHDRSLISWIRARNLNLDLAEEMIRKSISYRGETGMDSRLLAWKAPAHYEQCFPYQHCGYEKDTGLPIIIVPACWWEPYVRKELAAGNKDVVHRYINQVAYIVLQDMKLKYQREKRMITQFVIIFDLRGFCIKHCYSIAAQEVMLVAFRRFDANFPETLKVAYVINAPKVFSIMYTIVKSILSSRTLEKVMIFDSTVERWQKVLLKNIEVNQLPKYYGGIMCDTLQNGMELDEKIHEVKLNEMIISPGGDFELEFEISVPRTVISWTFKTENFNIGFAVKNEENILVPYRRLDSHETIQHGSVTCFVAGRYTLIFDNSFSRFRTKKLHYHISADEPQEDENTSSKTIIL